MWPTNPHITQFHSPTLPHKTHPTKLLSENSTNNVQEAIFEPQTPPHSLPFAKFTIHTLDQLLQQTIQERDDALRCIQDQSKLMTFQRQTADKELEDTRFQFETISLDLCLQRDQARAEAMHFRQQLRRIEHTIIQHDTLQFRHQLDLVKADLDQALHFIAQLTLNPQANTHFDQSLNFFQSNLSHTIHENSTTHFHSLRSLSEKLFTERSPTAVGVFTAISKQLRFKSHSENNAQIFSILSNSSLQLQPKANSTSPISSLPFNAVNSCAPVGLGLFAPPHFKSSSLETGCWRLMTTLSPDGMSQFEELVSPRPNHNFRV